MFRESSAGGCSDPGANRNRRPFLACEIRPYGTARPDRDVTVGVELEDNTDAGALSVERRLEKLEDASKKTSRRMSENLRRSGDDGARGFVTSFTGRIGPLAVRMGGSFGPQIATGVAAASPLIAATVGAAISGGAALGAIGLGAAIVSQEPVVRSAAARMGQSIATNMRVDARPMIGPVVAGIRTIEARANKLRPAFQSIFANAGRYASQLIGPIDQSLDMIVRGLDDVVAGAGPVIDVFATQLPRTIGVVVGGIKQITAESENSAAALSTVFTVVQAAFAATAGVISVMNKILPVTSGLVLLANDAIVDHDEASKSATASDEGFWGSLLGVGAGANTAASGVGAATRATVSFTQATDSAFSAETRFGQALADARDKANQNSAGLSINSEKGRQNRQVLGTLAAASRDAAAAAQHHGGGAKQAADIMRRGYDAFIKAATGMGISAAAARQLAADLGLIRSKTVTITTKYVVTGPRGGVHVSGGSTRTGGTQVSGFDASGWTPALAAAALSRTAAKFAALAPGSMSRTGGPVEVTSNVAVLLDGRPFREQTVRAVDDRARRDAWRSRVGRRAGR